MNLQLLINHNEHSEKADMLDIYETLLDINTMQYELGDMIKQYNTVRSISSTIAEHGICQTMQYYAGDAIESFAPAFVEGNSEEAVQQMEEGLKEVGKKIKEYLKRLIEKIKAFFKKVIGYFKKDTGSTSSKVKGMRDKIEKLLMDADEIAWKDGTSVGTTLYFYLNAGDEKKVLEMYGVCEKAISYLKKKNYDGLTKDLIDEIPLVRTGSSSQSFITPEEFYLKVRPVFDEPKLMDNIETVYKKLKNIKLPNDIPEEAANTVYQILTKANSMVLDYINIVDSTLKAFKHTEVIDH